MNVDAILRGADNIEAIELLLLSVIFVVIAASNFIVTRCDSHAHQWQY